MSQNVNILAQWFASWVNNSNVFKFKLESDGDNKTDKDFNNWIPKTAAKLPGSTMAKVPEDDNGGLGDSTANYGEGQ